MLEGKTICFGVCACTPAYRSIDIASRLKNLGADVKVILTNNASHFVTPLSLQRASGNPVQIEQFDAPVVWDRTYQSWTLSGDLMLLAPASADMLGKAANGIADDLLSTNLLSFEGPKLIAMNMSPMLYRNAAVQRNVTQLAEDGYYFIDNQNPDNPSGMPSVDLIVDAVIRFLG
jgi:phosphopantothenoylcysteine synthetase/decarboxylase